MIDQASLTCPAYIGTDAIDRRHRFQQRRLRQHLKTRIASARFTAACSVNSKLVGLYWDIGAAIREKQAVQGWGDGVVERLSSDLKRAFPGTTGFSAINLWRMRQLHETFTVPAFSHSL